MTREEKVEFLYDLSASIYAQMVNDLDRTPENWDGHELRQWLIDRTTRGAGELRDKRRRRDYRDEVAVRNL